MTRGLRIGVLAITLTAALAATVPSSHVGATTPPTTVASEPGVPSTNDLLPENNEIDNCVGTLESANCGSRGRADGHTYLVFLALAAGLGFIGWRIARGVRARDTAASDPGTQAPG